MENDHVLAVILCPHLERKLRLSFKSSCKCDIVYTQDHLVLHGIS